MDGAVVSAARSPKIRGGGAAERGATLSQVALRSLITALLSGSGRDSLHSVSWAPYIFTLWVLGGLTHSAATQGPGHTGNQGAGPRAPKRRGHFHARPVTSTESRGGSEILYKGNGVTQPRRASGWWWGGKDTDVGDHCQCLRLRLPDTERHSKRHGS